MGDKIYGKNIPQKLTSPRRQITTSIPPWGSKTESKLSR